ncbi:hypothetical protein [Streptosporangium canum]|uniref:hypothetical protein n=1 Tax=Streptosporangium canum TaxID=324952 RepID=UPI003789F4F1
MPTTGCSPRPTSDRTEPRPGPVAIPSVPPLHCAADLHLSPVARTAIEAGGPAFTRRAYAADWKAFTAWCAACGRVPLSATPATVTEYVTHLSTALSARTDRPLAPPPSSAPWRRSAPCTRPPTPRPRRPKQPARCWAATGCVWPSPAIRRPAPCRADPAVPEALRTMLAACDRTTPAGKRDAALLLGYACSARVSELAALDIADVVETADGLLVTIYRRKIKAHTETAVPYSRIPATCSPPWPTPGTPPDRCLVLQVQPRSTVVSSLREEKQSSTNRT